MFKEDVIIELTYKDKLNFDFQYDLMQIILQEIKGIRFDEKVKQTVDANCKHLSPDLQHAEFERLRKDMIMEHFKTTCFDAWKFKNMVLALDGLNAFNRIDLDNLKENIDKITSTAESHPDDKYYQPFFEKLGRVLRVLLTMSIGKMKIENSKSKLKEIQAEKENSNLMAAECYAKLELLQDLKRKLQEETKTPEMSISNKNSNNDEESIHQDFKDFVKDLKGLKNSLHMGYNTFLKEVGQNLIKPNVLEGI